MFRLVLVCMLGFTLNQLVGCGSAVQKTELKSLISAPQNLEVIQGNSQITLNWPDSEGATSYNLYIASEIGLSPDNYSNLADGNVSINVISPFNYTSLQNGTTYYFILTAINGGGESLPSLPVLATPNAPLPPGSIPTVPQNLNAIDGVRQIELKWPITEGITSYNLYIATTPGVRPDNYFLLSDGEVRFDISSSFLFSPLPDGTTYYFVITALNESGESPPSIEASATTTAQIQDSVIALYEFRTGSGTIAYDTSGVDPPLHLVLTNVDWISGRGIEFITIPSKAQAGQLASTKLYDKIADSALGASNQYTIETWLIPSSIFQSGPARIINYSLDTINRNFGMAQTATDYSFRNRTINTGTNGTPALDTFDAFIKVELQHIAMTFDSTSGRKIYINGLFTGDRDVYIPASLTNWDSTYKFILGNETTDNRQWLGKMLMVAIHNRALTEEEILQNSMLIPIP